MSDRSPYRNKTVFVVGVHSFTIKTKGYVPVSGTYSISVQASGKKIVTDFVLSGGNTIDKALLVQLNTKTKYDMVAVIIDDKGEYHVEKITLLREDG